jgi:predicted amidohydrolase
MLHVAASQIDIAWEDKPANFARVRELVATAHLPSGTVLFLPEMFASGFSMNVDAIADDGATESFLRELARAGG